MGQIPLPLLLVDDDDAVLRSLADVLGDACYTLTLATNGHDAIVWLKEASARGAPFLVVVTDIQMPGVDGFAVMNVAHRQPQPAGVILLTDTNDIVIALRLLEEKVFGYLIKPCSPAKLSALVERAVAYYVNRVHNSPTTTYQIRQSDDRARDAHERRQSDIQ